MIGEIPSGQLPALQKLVDRNSIIGCFLPSALGVVAAYLLINWLRPGFIMSFLLEEAAVWHLVSFASLIFLGGAMLLILSGKIARLLEGEWLLEWRENSNCLEKRRHSKLKKKMGELDSEYNKYTNNNRPPELVMKRSRLVLKLANEFPSEKYLYLFLPTSFGNRTRAFEVYAYEMYGIDPAAGWSRLLSVIPEKYQDNLNHAKAIMDFWLNLGAVSFLVFLIYIGFGIDGLRLGHLKLPDFSFRAIMNVLWIPLIVVASCAFSYFMARNAATEWGKWVKSAFDLYLPQLCRQLEFSLPGSKEQERDLWTSFSTAVLYGAPASMPDRESPEAPSAYSCALRDGRDKCRRTITKDPQ